MDGGNTVIFPITDALPFECTSNARHYWMSDVTVSDSNVEPIGIPTAHKKRVKDRGKKPIMQPMQSREPNFRELLEHNGDEIPSA